MKNCDALIENQTWSLVPLLTSKRLVSCKWAYKIKRKADSYVERCKARLVARDFTHVSCIDYHNTFSPTTKMIIVRYLLVVAASQNWSLHQLDVNNAFLNGDLLEEIYMSLPPGLRRHGENLVCRLHKSLYGLKQASYQWVSKFTEGTIWSLLMP
ncbi:hypothetical protein ACLB2K_048645 [Fragaria x ananassa]